MKKRTVLVGLLLTAALCAGAIQLYRVATSNAIHSAAGSQSRSTVTVARVRGTIYDCKLRPMVNVNSENRYAVFPDNQTVAALASCVEDQTARELTERFLTKKPFSFTSERLLPLMRGVSAFRVPVRYEDTGFAVHLIGQLDSTATHGTTGAEWAFDEYLAAAEGVASVSYTVGGAGERLADIAAERVNTVDQAKAGVALTVDKDIQTVAERVADGGLATGAIVVMDPYTGGILAMVSRPGYTRSSLADCLERADAPLVNRALSNYNLGSVFKIVSSIAALEAGCSVDTTFNCTGGYQIGDTVFRCHDRLGHGKLDLFGGFSESCNPYYIQLMQKIGGDRLYHTAETLGFTRDITLAPGWHTATANLPTKEQLTSPATLANLSFGQGELLATPVHMASVVSAVVNYGRLSPPTLFAGVVDQDISLSRVSAAPKQYGFSAATAVTVKRMMVEVVENGLGKSAKPKGSTAGGKTGTAQTGVIGENGEEKVQSWFAGFFPATNPRYVAVVVSEDAQSTKNFAAPLFGRLAAEILKLSA